MTCLMIVEHTHGEEGGELISAHMKHAEALGGGIYS